MYIYLIQCEGRDGYIKIGSSHNVESRLADLQVGCPYKLKIIHTMKYPSKKEAQLAETRLHRTLKKWKIRGEWFQPSVRHHIMTIISKPQYSKKINKRDYVINPLERKKKNGNFALNLAKSI